MPDYDQPKVAAHLSSVIHYGNLTSAYCVEGIKGAKEYNRIEIVKKVLPFCTDLTAGGGNTIKASLTEWEKVVLNVEFKRYF